MHDVSLGKVALKSTGKGVATLGQLSLGQVKAFNVDDSNDRAISDVGFQLVEHPEAIYVLSIADGSVKKLAAKEVARILQERAQLKEKKGSKKKKASLRIQNVALLKSHLEGKGTRVHHQRSPKFSLTLLWV